MNTNVSQLRKSRSKRSSKRSRKFGQDTKVIISDFENKHEGVNFDKINKNLDHMINTFIKIESVYYTEADIDVMLNFFNENLRPILHAGLINNEIYPKDTINYVMNKYYPNNKNRNPRIPTSKYNFFINNPLTSFKLLFTRARINSPNYRPSIEWCKKINRE
jgi:hypothetical protein